MQPISGKHFSDPENSRFGHRCADFVPMGNKRRQTVYISDRGVKDQIFCILVEYIWVHPQAIKI